MSEGQSVEMWERFFPNAHIFGIDFNLRRAISKHMRSDPRVSLFKADAYREST